MKENADKARGLDAGELAKQIKDAAEQMFRLRFQMSMGQMDGIKKVRTLRKERARILTVLKQKGLAPSAAAAAPVPLVTKTKQATAPKTAKAASKKTAPKAAVQKKAAANKAAPNRAAMTGKKGR